MRLFIAGHVGRDEFGNLRVHFGFCLNAGIPVVMGLLLKIKQQIAHPAPDSVCALISLSVAVRFPSSFELHTIRDTCGKIDVAH